MIQDCILELSGKILKGLETIMNSRSVLMYAVRSENILQLVKHVADLAILTGERESARNLEYQIPWLTRLHCLQIRVIH